MKIQTSKETITHRYIADLDGKDTVTIKVGDIEFGLRYNIITASIEFYSFASREPFFEINKSELLLAKYGGGKGEYTCLRVPTEVYEQQIKPLLKDVLMVKP